VKDPQTFNRYTYALNSPYKFTDPLGLISSSTGACGQWCPGSGSYVDGSSFIGTDNTFSKMFNDMALNNEVEQALENLEDYVQGTIEQSEAYAVGEALKHMLKKGNAVAKRIASNIINSNIRIEASSTNLTAVTDILDVSKLNTAIKNTYLTLKTALAHLVIRIPKSEFTNAISPEAAIESTLVHEGLHAESIASVIASITNYGNLDKNRQDDEYDAKVAAAEYEIYMKGDYVKHGQNSNVTSGQGLITSKGKVNYSLISNIAKTEPNKSVRAWLKAKGVTW
jgi:hypothetical protein